MANKHSQVQIGALFSYVLIFLNATYGMFLTPYILGQIGEAAFGVYKTISSFTAALMVLDLGLGGTMMRYIAKYRADKEDKKISNFIAMGLIQTVVICGVVAIVTSVLYFFLDSIYANGLSASELVKAKQLYIFMALGMVAHIVQNFLNGITSGYNKFIFANGVKVARLLIRILAVVVFLGIYKDSLTLVMIDLVVTCLFGLIEFLYIVFKLNVKVKLTKWDNKVFFESFKYTILMFLTSIVAQVNGNFSNVAIGALMNSTAVTVYSMAILIFSMYEQLSTAISGVMLPTVTNSLKNDDEKLTNTIRLVVQTGRIQFILLGAAFAGFIILGRPFIEIWLGKGFGDIYPLTLILLGPALLELCINVCLSILRAKNIIGFRTGVITFFTGINILITLFFTSKIGYYASAIGTAISFLFGSVITMCIYYRKKLGINMIQMYKNIFNRIWICIILSGLASFAITCLCHSVLMQFLAGAAVFVIVYFVTLMVFGLNKDERNIITNIIRRKQHD